MKVSGQIQSPAALPPEKERPAPTGQEGGWAPEPVTIMQFCVTVRYYRFQVPETSN
jgi:hypothetical protein